MSDKSLPVESETPLAIPQNVSIAPQVQSSASHTQSLQKTLPPQAKAATSANAKAGSSVATKTVPPTAKPAPAAAAPAKPKTGSQFSQEDLNRIVLEYLNKQGYHKTESMLRYESSGNPTAQGPPITPANTAIVKRTAAEAAAASAAVKRAEDDKRMEMDPEIYYRAYRMLRGWVETSLDLYKPELTRVLYPIFIHCFLELVSKHHVKESKAFFDKFSEDHAILHGIEIQKLSGISTTDHLLENELAQAFKLNRYRIVVSKTSLNLLLYFLHENEAVGGGILIRIINQYLEPSIDSTSTIDSAKNDQPGELDPEEGILGITGVEEIDTFNSQSVKLGKLPMDPEFAKEVEAELKDKDDKSPKVNGKTLVEEFKEMTKEEEEPKENFESPSREILPLPVKTAYDLKREILSVQDSRAKINIDSIQATAPSVCMYTFHNTNNDMNCLEFNDDSTMVAAGFSDSFVKLWSIDGNPLSSILKKDGDGADHNLHSRRLVGHSGSVYGVSFSPDNRYLLSSSEDKTTRLWSLDTYTALVSYKGHNAPVWDVKFSPYGFYFATASHDQTARLWSCDHIYPLRIFAGHLNDVDCVEFHPNSTYLFTGSSDKTCRMWDINKGNSTRIFIGHTGVVNCMAVSPDGRWLASAGEDCTINVWDIGSGRRLKSMRGHGKATITSLSFSREGSVLVSGSTDNSIRVWDIKRGTNDSGPQPEPFSGNPLNAPSSSNGANGNANAAGDKDDQGRRRREVIASADHMTAYFTKRTPLYKVHFTRRNLCLAGGPFQPQI
ncbi:hypothetical protein BABINDRAFT_162268 [Babjeviella inositovora NRRL Y-12698]|uniref:TFIID subunit TAF5 NTD2 domain-containing protein n=1 Tax=Babjeviella inositovora NRRL Y-12698 TaxID=984486 RepID=A0A1E3QNH6_9ASCO|nr:uncharacterized protein BABINDRAFT_162268 [Babjeviella inositovora NRRL Y-12698]ODQ79231.1 hypothetical protein BABINDRAFT_162268 [Babjeviella inositovora NRRL Y-12698]